MANFYSNTLASNQVTSVFDNQFVADQSRRGGRMRVASGNWTNGTDVTSAAAATSHYIVLFKVSNHARIWDLFAYGGGEETSVTVDIGVGQFSSETGLNNNVPNSQEFASLLTIGSTAADSTSVFDEAMTLLAGNNGIGRQRGQTLAELTGVACSGNEWAVVARTGGTASVNVANFNIGAFCYYTDGD